MTMTYNLAMALHPKIEIKKDGVVEVGMTDARAALTSLIREVSWGHRPGAFTERGTRVAMVVPLDFYEQAARDREIVERLRGMAHIPAGVSVEEHPDVAQRARIVYEALESAERDIAAAKNIAES
jgi:prevent-host-death family protein